MRVRICYTVDVSDTDRLAIARFGGTIDGIRATRQEVKAHYEAHGRTADDTVDEYVCGGPCDPDRTEAEMTDAFGDPWNPIH